MECTLFITLDQCVLSLLSFHWMRRYWSTSTVAFLISANIAANIAANSAANIATNITVIAQCQHIHVRGTMAPCGPTFCTT
jgi:hypothetical protein